MINKNIIKNVVIIALIVIVILISLKYIKTNNTEKDKYYFTYNKYIFNNEYKKEKYYLNLNKYICLNDSYENRKITKTNFRDLDKRTAQILKIKIELRDKYISILGDSISTFEGYSNDNENTNDTIGENKVYYTGNNYIKDVNDTWWMKVSNELEMNVLVNNSWSGDKVTEKGQIRNTQLHDNTGEDSGTIPDIIAVYLGINDFRKNITIEDFSESYDIMIKNMIDKYPKADIFLFNFVPNNSNSRTIEELEEFNKVVKNTAEKYNCKLVDLYNNTGINEETMYSYMGDKTALHPNVKGMEKIANTFIDTLIKKYIVE